MKVSYHVTRMSEQGVYGHPTSRCDEAGCAAGQEWFLGSMESLGLDDWPEDGEVELDI